MGFSRFTAAEIVLRKRPGHERAGGSLSSCQILEGSHVWVGGGGSRWATGSLARSGTLPGLTMCGLAWLWRGGLLLTLLQNKAAALEREPSWSWNQGLLCTWLALKMFQDYSRLVCTACCCHVHLRASKIPELRKTDMPGNVSLQNSERHSGGVYTTHSENLSGPWTTVSSCQAELHRSSRGTWAMKSNQNCLDSIWPCFPHGHIAIYPGLPGILLVTSVVLEKLLLAPRFTCQNVLV